MTKIYSASDWDDSYKSKKSSYSEQLKDPKWSHKRKEVFKKYGEKCCICGGNMFLHVHHLSYVEGKKAWEYPLSNFRVLCEDCHKAVHDNEEHRLYPKYLKEVIPSKKKEEEQEEEINEEVENKIWAILNDVRLDKTDKLVMLKLLYFENLTNNKTIVINIYKLLCIMADSNIFRRGTTALTKLLDRLSEIGYIKYTKGTRKPNKGMLTIEIL